MSGSANMKTSDEIWNANRNASGSMRHQTAWSSFESVQACTFAYWLGEPHCQSSDRKTGQKVRKV